MGGSQSIDFRAVAFLKLMVMVKAALVRWRVAGSAEGAAGIAAQAGMSTSEGQARWLDVLRTELAAGRFLGGQLHLFVWGTRPAS
jgi:hypothetical protein